MREWKMKRKGGEEQTKIKGNSVDKKGGRRKEKKRERKTDRWREEEMGRKENEIFLDIPTVEARRFEKKSRSTHQELRVGTKIWEFRQNPRGREFSYFDYF